MSAVFLLCLKIFLCRIVDVSLATIRTIINVKGRPKVASIIGFVEALIWFLIVKEALLFDSETGKIFIAVAYSLGFAMGTLVGGILAEKFVGGNVDVQVVTSNKNDSMIDEIREDGYAITVLDVNNSRFGKKKYMLFSEIKSTQLKDFKSLIYSLDKKAFIMVRETKFVYNGFFKK